MRRQRRGAAKVNLGFVGLGAMGELIVPRLMQAGHRVTGWNRSHDKAKPLIEAGMQYAPTPRAVAEASEIVFSIVTDSAAVKAVALGPDGIVSGLRKGGIYIDMSTIEPDASRAVAAEFAKTGSIMLDGPLSGSPVTVKAGQASIMIGGDEAAFERAKPVLPRSAPRSPASAPTGWPAR
jgi:3-hydroxyisobutyrate dehydrogenase-like beta-hydroxyacid dehydrogenase